MGSPCKLPSASVALPPGLGGFLSVPAEEAQEHRVTSQRLSCGAGPQQVTDWRTTLTLPFREPPQGGLVDLLNRPLRQAFTPDDDHRGKPSPPTPDVRGGVKVVSS